MRSSSGQFAFEIERILPIERGLLGAVAAEARASGGLRHGMLPLGIGRRSLRERGAADALD